MAVGVCVRLVLRAAVLSAFLVAPQLSSAQSDASYVDTDASFYGALASQRAGSTPASTGRSNPVRGRGAVVKPVPELNGNEFPVVSAGTNKPFVSAAPPPPEHRLTFVGMITALAPVTWAMLVLGIVFGGFVLWAGTPLPCLVLGHRRSRMSVSFDDHKQLWRGKCKSCGVPLVRDAAGGWKAARATSRNPLPLEIAVVPPAARNHAVIRAPLPQPEPSRPGPLVEAAPSNGHDAIGEYRPRARENTASKVAQLLDDVLGGHAPPPGGRGALFFAVDELRSSPGMEEQTLCAMKISIRMQQLEGALQRGDQKDAKSARRELKALAGEWMKDPICSEHGRSLACADA